MHKDIRRRVTAVKACRQRCFTRFIATNIPKTRKAECVHDDWIKRTGVDCSVAGIPFFAFAKSL